MRVYTASRKYPCIPCSSTGYALVEYRDTRRSDALKGEHLTKLRLLRSHRPGQVDGSVLGRSIHRARQGIVETPHSRVHAFEEFHLVHVHLVAPVPAQVNDRAAKQLRRECPLKGAETTVSVPAGRSVHKC